MSFIGIYGNVTITDNGDREADYSLWDMTDPEAGTFEVGGRVEEDTTPPNNCAIENHIKRS